MAGSENAEVVGSRLRFNGDRDSVDLMMIEVMFYVYIAIFYKANILRRRSSTEILHEQRPVAWLQDGNFALLHAGL